MKYTLLEGGIKRPYLNLSDRGYAIELTDEENTIESYPLKST